MFVDYHKHLVIIPINRLENYVIILYLLQNSSFDGIPLGRSFGVFDGNMKGKLIKLIVGILFSIKKAKKSSRKILSLSGEKYHIFAL